MYKQTLLDRHVYISFSEYGTCNILCILYISIFGRNSRTPSPPQSCRRGILSVYASGDCQQTEALISRRQSVHLNISHGIVLGRLVRKGGWVGVGTGVPDHPRCLLQRLERRNNAQTPDQTRKKADNSSL